MAALVIGEKQREQIAALIADATANPIDEATDIEAAIFDVVDVVMRQSLELPVGYLITYSHEREPGVGLCHNISICVRRPRKMPHPKAVEMILKEFGMRPLGDTSSKVQIDDSDPVTRVLTVVQPVDCGRSSGMVALSSVLHTTSRQDANTGRTGTQQQQEPPRLSGS